MIAEPPRFGNEFGSHQTPTYSVEGTGPLLVYVAGLDGTGELFFKQVTDLTRSFRVVTFRSREHGEFGYADLCNDIAWIIRDIGAEKAMILGESFGGTVALHFALAYQEMVERLIVINSFARFPSQWKIKTGAWLASILPFSMTWLMRRSASTIGLLVDGVNSSDRRRFFETIRTVPKEAYARRLQLIAGLNLEPVISDIHTPTLFIAGERDLLLPSAVEAKAMAARMPNATVQVIQGVGHACLLGKRTSVAEILAEWIGGRPERCLEHRQS